MNIFEEEILNLIRHVVCTLCPSFLKGKCTDVTQKKRCVSLYKKQARLIYKRVVAPLLDTHK